MPTDRPASSAGGIVSRFDRRKALFACLYFSEGAPIGFIWWAMPTLLRERGLPLDAITSLTAMLVLPWTFKFLWAPLVDACRTSWWSYRQWILSCHVVMVAALCPLFFADITDDLALLRTTLLVHAIAAATQDIAIDAWCIRMTHHDERGRFNGWMQAGMLLGRSIFGGGALVVVGMIGWSPLISLMMVAVASSSVLVILTPSTHAKPNTGTKGSRPSLVRTLRDLGSALRRPVVWMAFAFALTGGAAFEALGAVQGPMLIDLGIARESVGWLIGGPMVGCMLLGSLVGGYVTDRVGHRRTVRAALLAMVLPIALLAFVLSFTATGGDDSNLVAVVVTLLIATFLAIGLFIAATYAYFMDLSASGKYEGANDDDELQSDESDGAAGTRFTAFMSATNGCEAWAGAGMGWIGARAGYAVALVAMCAVSMLGLVLVRGRRGE